MAHAATKPAATTADLAEPVRPDVHGMPVTPGKVAVWLFLATEIMFFTGLIGSYIVLRSGSPPNAYSDKFAPGTVVKRLPPGEQVTFTQYAPGTDFKLLPAEEYDKVNFYQWPKPYDTLTNPLSIDLTAINTFILICSSVTMVLALSAVQRNDRPKFLLFLWATVAIGSVFLSIQVYEYSELMLHRHFPIGISRTGHFTPNVSIFASCFFTMTGFHGAHVTGGVILLACIGIQATRGAYNREHHSPVELAGLYWHFVDLVWIILFTVVYLI